MNDKFCKLVFSRRDKLKNDYFGSELLLDSIIQRFEHIHYGHYILRLCAQTECTPNCHVVELGKT